MIAAALALLAIAVVCLGRLVLRIRAQRPQTGVFAGLAAEIDRLCQDEVAPVTTVAEEWEPMRRAA